MKILMLIDSMDMGGAETHVEILASELVATGNEITVACAGGKISERMAHGKINFISLPPITSNAPKYSNSSLPCRILFSKRILSRLIKKEKPDIVHAHTRRTAFISQGICKRYKIPLVVTAHAQFSMRFPKNLLSKWGDGTIAVSEDIKNHVALYGARVKRLEIIFNGVKLPKGDVGKCEK